MLNPMETSHTVIPAFIAKLWHMVEDETSDDLISWGRDGTTFLIKDHNKFSSDMLPMYYKHNNMASFIRQLNMYSFHKVLMVESSSLKNQNELEFSHPHFLKDHPELLTKITRKIHQKEQTDVKCDPEVFNNLLSEVKQLRAIQELFTNKLSVMKKENAALWREHSILRQRHAKQEKIVNKVIHFLISMVQQSSLNTPARRKVPLMIKDRPLLARPNYKKRYVRVSNPKSPPIICEVDPEVLADSQNKLIGEEISPEELLGYDEEEEDNEEALHLLDEAEMEAENLQQMKDNQPRIILKAAKRKSSEPISSGGKKAKVIENENIQYILPINLDDAVSPSNITNDSAPSPQYILLDNGNGVAQLVSTSELGNGDQVSTGNGSIVNSQVGGEQPAQSFVQQKSPYPVVTSPTPSVPSPAPPQTISAPMSSQPVLSPPQQPEPTTPNKLLQLAIPKEDEIKSHEDVRTHLDKVESDLDILKDLLKGEGISLDANMVLDLFNDNPMAFNMGPAGKPTNPEEPSSSDQALMSYTPSLLDLENEIAAEAEELGLEEEPPEYVLLNTPQIKSQEPLFPDPS